MKRYIFLTFFLMIFVLPLSACVPENYTEDQKEAVLTKGQSAIEKWLSENESDANLIECDINEGGYRSLSSLVSGTYERNGEIYECYCETITGQIYTSELNKNLAELLSAEVSKAVVPENTDFSVKVENTINVGFFEKEDNMENVTPDSTSYVNGFAVDADDSVYENYKAGIISGETRLDSVTFETNAETKDFSELLDTGYLFETDWINRVYLECADGEIFIYKSREAVSEVDSEADSESTNSALGSDEGSGADSENTDSSSDSDEDSEADSEEKADSSLTSEIDSEADSENTDSSINSESSEEADSENTDSSINSESSSEADSENTLTSEEDSETTDSSSDSDEDSEADSGADSEADSENTLTSEADSESDSEEIISLYYKITTNKEYIYPDDENVKFLYEDYSEYLLKKDSDTFEKKSENLTNTSNFKYSKTSDGFEVCGEKLFTVCFKEKPESDKLEHQIGSSHYKDSIIQSEDGWYKLVVGRDSQLIASIGEGEMIEFEWIS